MKYVEPNELTKSDFNRIIVSKKDVDICEAIVSSAYSISDYKWLLLKYSELLKYKNLDIVGVVITCLGHLARLNDDAEKKELLSLIEPFLENNYLKGRAEDAIDDVEMFS